MSDTGKILCTVRIDDKKCQRCYTCIQACPTSALTLDGVAFVHNAEDCCYDECCLDVCPEEAITILEG